MRIIDGVNHPAQVEYSCRIPAVSLQLFFIPLPYATNLSLPLSLPKSPKLVPKFNQSIDFLWLTNYWLVVGSWNMQWDARAMPSSTTAVTVPATLGTSTIWAATAAPSSRSRACLWSWAAAWTTALPWHSQGPYSLSIRSRSLLSRRQCFWRPHWWCSSAGWASASSSASSPLAPTMAALLGSRSVGGLAASTSPSPPATGYMTRTPSSSAKRSLVALSPLPVGYSLLACLPREYYYLAFLSSLSSPWDWNWGILNY